MRLACVQTDVVFSDPAANAAKAVAHLESLKGRGVQMAVFPEAFLTGYCVDCLEDAGKIAIRKDDPSLEQLRAASERLDMVVVLGFAEAGGDLIYNTAVLLEPGVEPRYYRKSHLPILGLDRFVCAGDDLPVFETRHGKVGILICFDQRLPEPTRVLALKGAELIVLPTNWPGAAKVSAEHISIARAAENRVFFATCNRVGTEHGFTFIGLSKIIAPNGDVLAAAGDGEEVIVADIELSEARIKRNVNVPGKYETTVFECRNPALYRELL